MEEKLFWHDSENHIQILANEKMDFFHHRDTDASLMKNEEHRNSIRMWQHRWIVSAKGICTWIPYYTPVRSLAEKETRGNRLLHDTVVDRAWMLPQIFVS